MNEFEQKLMLLSSKADELQKSRIELEIRANSFTEELGAFLKEHGLPENFTMPQLALLAIRQSRK